MPPGDCYKYKLFQPVNEIAACLRLEKWVIHYHLLGILFLNQIQRPGCMSLPELIKNYPKPAFFI